MRRRLNLLAFAVIAGGAALLGTPAPARATYRDPRLVLLSCCSAWDGWSRITRCCGYNGCVITASGCTAL
jgi:hypothetical protein